MVEAVLAANPVLVRAKIPPAAVGGESQLLDHRGELRTLPSQWPERAGLDGFYAAALTKQ